jgi:8-oxo-dGTP diphosphatase
VEETLKTIEVVAAIIIENNKILATKRGYGDFQGGWEFPGGKIEPGETKEEALIREIKEELVIDIKVGKLLETVEYNYPKFHLTMYCYICKFISGKIVLKEHEDAKWVTKDELDSIEWLPADLSLIETIKKE